MILAIDIPKDAKIIVESGGGKVFIIFNEKDTRMDLWKASFTAWLTEGMSIKEFIVNKLLSSKRIEISHRNKLSMKKGG